MDKEQEFVNVDIQSLSSDLAMESMKREMKDTLQDDLYTVVVDKDGPRREIRSRFAHQFFNIRDLYIKLIRSFSKEVLESTEKEE